MARDLDLTETAVRGWVRQADVDASYGPGGLTTAERAELARLRAENRVLHEERDILKRALPLANRYRAAGERLRTVMPDAHAPKPAEMQ